MMPSSLDRLNELVRQAEAKTRAKKLGSETQQAAEQFRAAEERARLATQRLREIRPAKLRQIEQAEADEQQRKELVKKLAQFKTALEPGADAEALIDTAKAEIERSTQEAQATIEAVTKEAEEARRVLRVVMEHYQLLRRELDRLQPQLAEGFSGEDRLVWDAETYFPGGQLQSLAREIDSGAPFYGSLSRPEQYAQLKIWIGRYRQFQESGDPELTPTDENQALSMRVFHQLKSMSKQYEPGYIEAFRHDYHTDWTAYIAEAQDQLVTATEAGRRSRDIEHLRNGQALRDSERLLQSREIGRVALIELKSLMSRLALPDEGLDEFLDVLKTAINGLGASDQELLELAMPFRDVITGGNGLRALRRNLDKIKQEEASDADPLQGQHEDLIAVTRGRRSLMIGGSVREDVRKTLQRIFEFDRLDWEPYEDSKPAALDSLEQRIRNHGVDLVLLLRSFIGHHVSERLRPLCQQHEIPCLMVEHGYGPAQVGETLRRGLLKSEPV